MNFTINKVKIHISFFFPAMIALFVINDKAGIIPPLLCGIVIHELTHIAVMILLNLKISKIHITALGIDIKREMDCTVLKKELLLHLSAPLVNLLLAFLFKNTLADFSGVNLVLALINLLPIGNLDGGNALSAVISACSPEKYKTVIKSAANIILGFTALIFAFYLFKYYNASPLLLFLILIMIFENRV